MWLYLVAMAKLRVTARSVPLYPGCLRFAISHVLSVLASRLEKVSVISTLL